jgi:two-component system response regulator MprA
LLFSLLRHYGPGLQSVIRLLIVDDQPFFADTVAAIALADGRIQIVGRAADGAEAVIQAGLLAPDVVVMDVEMPLLDGIEATRALRTQGFGAPILLVSGSDVEADVARARAAGADDFVHKHRAAAELVPRLTALVDRVRAERAAAAPGLAPLELVAEADAEAAGTGDTPA